MQVKEDSTLPDFWSSTAGFKTLRTHFFYCLASIGISGLDMGGQESPCCLKPEQLEPGLLLRWGPRTPVARKQIWFSVMPLCPPHPFHTAGGQGSWGEAS